MSRLSLACLLFVAACGGKSATPTPPGPKEAPLVAPPADMAFKDMSLDQRMAFMKLTVMPEMKKVFQEIDAKEFADFSCKTCHGKHAEDGSFEMPNADLERLPAPEGFPEYMKDPKKAAAVQAMAMKVKPAMAKLLKKSEYNPETNTGEFGCYGCHLKIGEVPQPKEHHH